MRREKGRIIHQATLSFPSPGLYPLFPLTSGLYWDSHSEFSAFRSPLSDPSFFFFFMFSVSQLPWWPLVRARPLGTISKEEKGKRQQIVRTRAKSQRIVAQRPLSRVQYPVLYLSRIQRICLSDIWTCYSASTARNFETTRGPSPYYDLGLPETAFAYSL